MKIISSMNIDGVAKVVCADLYKEDIDNFLSFNTHNRCLNRSRVEYLKSAINYGEWKFNGATIVVDGDGVLRDGQTRLSAFKEAGYPVFRAMIVYLCKCENDATEVQKTIDKCQPRKYSQQLMLDGIENAKNIASIRRSIALYIAGSYKSGRFADSELDKIGVEYKDEISMFYKLQSVHHALRFNAFTVGVICVLAKKYGNSNDLYEWCLKVADCDGISNGSTQYTFMRFLNSCKGRISGSMAKEVMNKTESIIMAHIAGNENMTKVYGKKGSK